MSAVTVNFDPVTLDRLSLELTGGIRGFTSLAERATPDAVATLLNRFYATAVDVLCEHAIIDKLVGDQVMALYLPRVFPGEPERHMLADARRS